MPVCVTIVDVQLAGLPLIYVNQEFCRVTGYSKSEAQGKNCRFLQGPQTQLASMQVIIDAIRRGEDCSVRLHNYKRCASPRPLIPPPSPARRLGPYSVWGCMTQLCDARPTALSRSTLPHHRPSMPRRLRHASGCHAFDYECHRSGEAFENLFSMRMVRGPSDDVRFAVGAQLSRNATDGQLECLFALLYLLPTKLVSGGSAYQQNLEEQEAREKGEEMLKTVEQALYAREPPKSKDVRPLKPTRTWQDLPACAVIEPLPVPFERAFSHPPRGS